jgi:hypothetical protein
MGMGPCESRKVLSSYSRNPIHEKDFQSVEKDFQPIGRPQTSETR